MDFQRAAATTEERFRESIVPRLSDYIRIPNKSPAFDAQWQEHGHMDRAAELMAAWCREQPINGLQVEILRTKGRTPLLFCEIPGSGTDTVLLYGHMDKQPEFTGWVDGLSPWEPVLRDGKLYGRGGADDGYAVFSSLTAIRLLQDQGIPHARCIVMIEACEESGSYDLPYYVDRLAGRVGTPSLVVCLDAECGNYEQLWCTTSLRGNLVGTLDRRTDGGRPFGRRHRHRPVRVPHCAHAARARRERRHRRPAGGRTECADSVGTHRPGPRRRRRARPPDRGQAAVRAGRAPADRFAGRTGPEQHLAPDAWPSPAPRACRHWKRR